MKKRRTILVVALSVIIGFLTKKIIDEYTQVTPEKALENAKKSFTRHGPISGSWIYMKPEEIKKNGLAFTAYHGGITRNEDGENKQYEFHTDIETGSVIDSVQTV